MKINYLGDNFHENITLSSAELTQRVVKVKKRVPDLYFNKPRPVLTLILLSTSLYAFREVGPI